MKKLDTRKLTSTAIFLSLALMLSIIENMLPPIVPFLPQAKIGIANIVILTSILLLGKWQALVIVIMRALINAIFSGNPVAFIYSFTAGVISYGVMVGLVRTRVLSLVAISCLSAMVHNFVQVCVAAVMTETSAVFVYLPYLAVIGGTAGAFIGLACHYIIKKYPLNTLSDSFKGGDVNNAERADEPSTNQGDSVDSDNVIALNDAGETESSATYEVDAVSDAVVADANQSNSLDSDNGAEPSAVEKKGSNASDVDTATSASVDCTTEGNNSDNSCDSIASDVVNVIPSNSEEDTATSEMGAESCDNGKIDNAK